MISKMLGAPFGGTTRAGHQGVEFLALSSITPPNFEVGGGSCFPSRVVVPLGEPGTPVICCAAALDAPAALRRVATAARVAANFPFLLKCYLLVGFSPRTYNARWILAEITTRPPLAILPFHIRSRNCQK
jgi:hypothetical protein